MKNKILLLASNYPAPDIQIANNTNVVHYFAREWVKMGYEVYIIFNYPIYFRLLHWIATLTKNLLASRFNTSVTTTYIKEDKEYELEGVKIMRMPLYKPFPRGKVPTFNLLKQIDKIHNYCKQQKFIPDFIVAHNFYPHLEIINALRDNFYPTSKTCIVVHKQNLGMLKYVANNYNEQIKKIDLWGFRSLPIKKEFEDFVGERKNTFICYSGVPAFFLSKIPKRDFQYPISRFVYVGSFIKRKYPHKVLEALKMTAMVDFHLDFVGDGILRKKLMSFVRENRWYDKVTFHGYLPREEVPKIVSISDCFVMISEEETFGLVYLEAMALGCITIASKNEGMEGIIIDGVNGFLCKAGDADELSRTIIRINRLTREERNRISINAQATACALSDKNVAELYVKSLSSLFN